MKIKEMKSEMKNKNEDEDMIVNRNIRIRLPKLLITKFEAANLDWLLYSSQF